MASDMKGPLRPTLYRFMLGEFEGGPRLAIELDVRRRLAVPVAAGSVGHGGHCSSPAPWTRIPPPRPGDGIR